LATDEEQISFLFCLCHTNHNMISPRRPPADVRVE
jgi:hypothetical protein